MNRLGQITILILAMAGAIGAVQSPVHAAETKAELKAKFEKRFPQLAKLLDQGKVGETWQGYVEPIKSERELNDEAKKLLAEENADRWKLYCLIANDKDKKVKDEEPVTVTAERVGERNGWRKFKEARPAWFLKTKDGVWIQRKDVDRLKRGGKIGEQWDGYLGAVSGAHAEEERVKAVLSVENHLRRYAYERRLEESGKGEAADAAVGAEAERQGKQNVEKVASGEFVKRSKSAEWEKKS